MNITNEIKKEIISIIKDLAYQEGATIKDIEISVEPPKDLNHGDLATNAAMIYAKQFEISPKDLASKIANKLSKIDKIDGYEIAGAGFINLKLNHYVWRQIITWALDQGVNFGDADIAQEEQVNVECVSCNPTGPMHVGHARGAAYGDSLCRLLKKAGYKVVEEFYVNDAGSQIDTLAKSVYLRYKESLGFDIGQIPEGFYPGDYLIEVGKKATEKYGYSLIEAAEEKWLPVLREFSVNEMLNLIKEDLNLLGIEHDVFTSEAELHRRDLVNLAIKKLEQKDLVYKGVLEPPKGMKMDDWEPREQLLFKSTLFGDDIDRPLQKSDGSWTYFASDAAYILDKIERGFKKQVLLLGADHAGYQKRMYALTKALSDNEVELQIKVNQLVNLYKNGKPFKMSKRAGNFITVKDVIEETGKDILRFIMLTRKNDMVLDFDLEKAKEQSKDNPVFYVQYAHARCISVLRNAIEEAPQSSILFQNKKYYLELLKTEEEMSLIKYLAMWPRIVEQAASHMEPHRIAYYLQELAANFHRLWNQGRDNPELKFIISSNIELTAARLALVKFVSIVIASGLSIFNVEPIENM